MLKALRVWMFENELFKGMVYSIMTLKEDYLKNVGRQTVDDFHSIKKNNGIQWWPTTVEIHTGSKQLEDE